MTKSDKNQKNVGPWTKVGTFDTFVEAVAKRNKIAVNKNTQTKVRRRAADNNFTVHYREMIEKKAAPKKAKKERQGRKEKREKKKKTS